jgi:hypothetical protein
MRFSVTFAAAIACLVMLDDLPAQAAVVPGAMRVDSLPVAAQGEIQPVWWHWHGRRYRHRRWVRRHHHHHGYWHYY